MRKITVVVLACTVAVGTAFAGTTLINGVAGNPFIQTTPLGTNWYPETGAGVASSGVWDAAVTSANGGMFATPNADGSLNLVLESGGRVKGTWSTTGAAGGRIASATDNPGTVWVPVSVEAGWLVPTGSDILYTSPLGLGSNINSRCYVGVEFNGLGSFGSGNGQAGLCGLEWNTANSVWRQGSDVGGVFGDASDPNFDISPAPQYYQARTTKDAAGVVGVEYAIDFGSWSYVTPGGLAVALGITNPTTGPFSAAGGGVFGTDGPTDAPGWSMRGVPSRAIKARVTSSDAYVPNSYSGIDSDGDGVLDENDIDPVNPAYFTDSDGDGLPDEWEIAYFLDLSQTAFADPDTDGQTNYSEYLAGTDPTQPPLAGVPVAGIAGLALLAGALLLAGRRLSARR